MSRAAATLLAAGLVGSGTYAVAATAQHDRATTADRAIALAAVAYRVDEGVLRRRAWCESRFVTGAVNKGTGATGLFQFLRSTWNTTPYARFSRLDAFANALAAAWMIVVGRGSEWACQ